MAATFARVKSWITGEKLKAADLNAEYDNILNNLTPSGVDDYSANTTQMQSTADPYPGSVESPATSLAGELERIRYLIKQITGEAQWYVDPDSSIAALSAQFPSGTAMVFYQAAAPTGWTKSTANNDKALRVVSGDGGGSGGSVAMSAGLSHHHVLGTTNSFPNTDVTSVDGIVKTHSSSGEGLFLLSTGAGTGTTYQKSAQTTDDSAGSLAYIDVIVCTKD